MTGPQESFDKGILHPDPDPDSLTLSRLVCLHLTISDADEAAWLYRDVFLADEPTSVRRAPDTALFLHYAKLYAGSLAKKNLSFIVRDERTDELAGFIFCVDLTLDPEREGEWMVAFLANFPEAVAMITELEDWYLNVAEVSPGTVLHIYQIGVSRKYRGQGIAQALIRRVLAHGRELGFRQVVADCTNPVSRRSFEQCGFHEKGFSSYEEFSLNGIRFFAGLEGGISLMTRDI
jgi:ribosomal protein S18 acetylase RimI-like enzyme